MKAAALRAVELDETLAVGHVRLGDALCFKDWAGAEREFLRALVLDPDSPEALSRYGLFLWARQRHDEALVQLSMALERDPFSLDTNWLLGFSYVSLDRAMRPPRRPAGCWPWIPTSGSAITWPRRSK